VPRDATDAKKNAVMNAVMNAAIEIAGFRMEANLSSGSGGKGLAGFNQ
jgi:hypothetical protein